MKNTFEEITEQLEEQDEVTFEDFENALVLLGRNSGYNLLRHIVDYCNIRTKAYTKSLFLAYCNMEYPERELQDMFYDDCFFDARYLANTRSWMGNKKVKVYRGMSKEEAASGNYGISWTLNKEVAEWFAKRNNGVVVEREVQTTQIVAYTNERNEKECIILNYQHKLL